MKIPIAVSLFLVLSGALAAAGPYTFTGIGLCSMCHRGDANHLVFEKWLTSKHAGAFKRLDPVKGEDKNPDCLSCHTTGFGAGRRIRRVENRLTTAMPVPIRKTYW